MISLISVLTIALASMLITRIGAIALSITGLSRDISEFQALSAFSGTGFTTVEAESIVQNAARRRIVMLLMMLGNAGVVTAIASLIFSFSGIEDVTQGIRKAVFLIAGLVVLLKAANSKWANRRLNSIIQRLLKKWTNIELADYESLLRIRGDYRVVEIVVREDSWLVDKSLMELELSKEGVIVLGVVRESGAFIGTPTGAIVLHSGDHILAYGLGTVIKEVADKVID